jgi:hypothetical protein
MFGVMTAQISELVDAWQTAESNYHEQLLKHFAMWWGDTRPEGLTAPEPMTLAALAKITELRDVADEAERRVAAALRARQQGVQQ